METQILNINDIKLNPNNPRLIKDDKFKKLVKSIKEFPEMLNIRPIVVNKEMIILGWNMRFKALKEAWVKEVPVIITDLSEEKQKEFLIKDNVSGWEWDFDLLSSNFDLWDIEEWWVDIKLWDDIDFDSIESNEDRSNSDKTREVECPHCWEKFSI